MKKKELLNGLRSYQKWRKGAETEMPDPKFVTRLIDSAITVIEKADKFNVNTILNENNTKKSTYGC